MQDYEVRGIKFLTQSNEMVMSHSCTFVISLRLASGSYWVTHCLFMDETAYSDHIRGAGAWSVVARGVGVAPSHLMSDAAWPKEILDTGDKYVVRSKAKLEYIRKGGEKQVTVKIRVWAKKFQTLQFNLRENKEAFWHHETFEMDGRVRAGFEGRWGEDPQSLERQPWGNPLDDRFAPD